MTLDEVAERAGVSPEFAQELVDAGAIEATDGAFTEGAIRRVMLVSACVDAGLPLEAIASALRSGHLTLELVDSQHYARWGQRTDVTWEQAAATAGVDFAFVQEIFKALGYAVPEPFGHPRTDDPALLMAFSTPLAAGWDPDALLRVARLYGESIRRITRAETQLWHENVDVPIERGGGSQRDILESSQSLGETIMEVLDETVLSIYHRLQEHAWMNDLVEHIELALVEAGVYTKPDRPVAMAFMDISGYTALTEERGDRAAADVASTLVSIVQRTAAEHDGEALKWLGDGVMFRFPDPALGVRAAIQLVGATTPARLPPAHIGVDVGAVVARDGDVFGRTVNLAARISGVAGPGQVLVTRDTVESGASAGVLFQPHGPVSLKGIANPIELFRAELDQSSPAA